MDENSKDQTETHVETVRCIVERPIPPGNDIRTPFKSVHAWLGFLCANEQRSEPVSEYMIQFLEPRGLLVCLVGYNHGMEQGVPTTRIVFQPKQYMWFKLPKKIYRRLTKEQLIDKVHAELEGFFTTEQFKNSFLARGYNISTNFQEDIWSL